MIAAASLATGAGEELGWGLMTAAAAYFAPTLLAVARHRGAAPLTFSVNLLLGWTGVGWLVAWFVAVADRRVHICDEPGDDAACRSAGATADHRAGSRPQALVGR